MLGLLSLAILLFNSCAAHLAQEPQDPRQTNCAGEAV
jgi:hypothetical protein